MSVSGVNQSSYSGISYPELKGKENSKPDVEPVKLYKISYDRVSKDVYDKYDIDGNNKISKEEEIKYKAEKSTENTETEKAPQPADAGKNTLMSNLGSNIDIFA